MMNNDKNKIEELLLCADELNQQLGDSVHDRLTASTFQAASGLSQQVVDVDANYHPFWEPFVDRLITSRWFGVPFMILLLAGVFWLTITGSNVPSAFLACILYQEGGLGGFFAEFIGFHSTPAFLSYSIYELLHMALNSISAPAMLTSFLVDGVYLALASVVAVMLPPMAIFFPLFTLMEDLGLLPRIAFNMDRFFRAAGAHGKQALTMSMGFGCNAAGVIACRIIDSPRERLIAIVTNNFVPCNGRWPTIIMVASLFVAAGFSGVMGSLIAVATVTAVAVLGVIVTLAVSFVLSRTMLKGVASSFTLELPPYRKPQLARILYTSLIDRTLKVLWRAIICAAPAGVLIWMLGAVQVGDGNLFLYLRNLLEPTARLIGLDGVILIAFIFAIPANEIVVPTIIMGYMSTSRMMELDDPSALFIENGWTMTTAICLLLFSLLHYPCSTTTYTIWKETRSVKWTILSNAIPTTIAIAVCFCVAQTSRWMGWF